MCSNDLCIGLSPIPCRLLIIIITNFFLEIFRNCKLWTRMKVNRDVNFHVYIALGPIIISEET